MNDFIKQFSKMPKDDLIVVIVGALVVIVMLGLLLAGMILWIRFLHRKADELGSRAGIQLRTMISKKKNKENQNENI